MNSRELRNFFASPVIPFVTKEQTIRVLFEQRVHRLTLEFLLFLLRKKREHIVLPIIDAVFDLHRIRMNVQRAAVRSARELSDGQKRRLEDALAAATKRTIEPEYSTDDGLIGGLAVRVGDMVFDGSVARQLQLLKHRMASGSQNT